MKTVETDVLIVGGGIAGSALACALRDTGYWVVLLDHRKDPLDTARGDHLQPSSVEALSRWGVLERFLERGACRRTGHEFRTETGDTLLKVDYAEVPIPHPYFLVYHHDLIAETLLEIAGEGSNFDLFKPAEILEFKVREDRIRGVRIRAENREVMIKPHLVVGADGASSVVRSALHFETHEYPYHHPLVVLLGPRPSQLRPEGYAFRFSGPKGVVGVQGRMDEEIKVALPVGAEGIPWWKDSTKEDRARLLGERACVLKGFESRIAGFYRLRMIQATEYVRGNVVLVGDAAHCIHPVRGQGMNMGLSSLSRLIGGLPGVSDISSFEKVRQALLQYQCQQKPLADRIIARNHEAAMATESSAGEDRAAFIAEQNEHIREIHARPELKRMHLLEVTGYPFGAPAEAEPDYLA